MKRFATGILFAAAAIYVPTRLYESMHPALGYLRAFCEAAMIGGLADWFAVTALFRHPLGVPLPHTAIIPSNKERIADALARFVEFNFLSTEVVTEKLGKIDFTQLAAQWMADPQRSGPAVAKIVEFLPRVLGMPGAAPLRRYAREQYVASLTDAKLPATLTTLLDTLGSDEGGAPLVEELAALVERHLGTTEQTIRAALAERGAPLWPALNLDAASAEPLLNALAQALAALHGERGAAARRQLAHWLRDTSVALRASPTLPARLEVLREALHASPAWSEDSQALWQNLATRLAQDASRADSGLRTALQAAVCGLGENIAGNMLVRMVLNMQIKQFLVNFVEARRHHAAELIADTMRTWDANTMSGRIEDAIGRDLQYIRINGTVIGGLIGVAIHTLATLVLH